MFAMVEEAQVNFSANANVHNKHDVEDPAAVFPNPPQSEAEVVALLPSKQHSIDRSHGAKTVRRRQGSKKGTLRGLTENSFHPPGTSDVNVDVVDEADSVFEDEEENWQRLQHVKDLTATLDTKRKKRSELLQSHTVKLTGFKKWRYNRAKEWKKTKVRIRETFHNLRIWDGAFKVIEGRFGSPVLAYFSFLKWLFLLNVFLAVITLGVIVFPQVFMSPASFQGYVEMPGIQGPGFDKAEDCSGRYDAHIRGVRDNGSFISPALDFFQGTGWMEQQVIFYGHYFNRTYQNLIGGDTVHYNMPVAYLCAVVAYFLVSLFLMVRFTAHGMKSRITSGQGEFYKACNKVFSGWDFSLSEAKAASFKHNHLYREQLRDLAIQRRKEKQARQTRARRWGLYVVRLIVNLLVLAILAASGYLIVYTSGKTIELQKKVLDDAFLLLLVQFLPSLTITALNFIVPLGFKKMVLAEDYSPTMEIKITIFRSVTLRLASVAVLIIGVGRQIVGCESDSCNACPGITLCWETYIAQQLYKLVLLDFITVVLMTFLIQLPRKAIVKRCYSHKAMQLVGYQEFEIPKEVLDIVYTQTLCWLGSFVSPLIPAITVVKLFLFFYIKKLTLLYNCIPASRVFRASNSQAFFMSILLLSFVLCVIPVAFAIGRIPPSLGCGPFRVYSSDSYFMFTAMTDVVRTWPMGLQRVLSFVSQWTFYIPLMVIICLIIYYYLAIASGQRRMVELLKEQLALEGKDKQYLLKQVRDAIAHGDFKTE